jgi:hypothetical protein
LTADRRPENPCVGGSIPSPGTIHGNRLAATTIAQKLITLPSFALSLKADHLGRCLGVSFVKFVKLGSSRAPMHDAGGCGDQQVKIVYLQGWKNGEVNVKPEGIEAFIGL